MYFQRDETSNTSTPTKLLPIDQIISHIANTNLEKQQAAQTPDSQAGAENTSAEASRRSSTSTQNTDTLTPTNIPSDPMDNQETIVSAISAETVIGTYNNNNNQDDANSAFKSYQNSTAAQDTAVNEAQKESQEQQDAGDIKESGMTKEASDVAAEVSNLTVPAPMRKVSRFLVSPVIEQKNVAVEDEASGAVGEAADRTSVTVSQTVSQPVVPTTNVESMAKLEDHVEANVPAAQSVTVYEQVSNNEMIHGIQYTMEQTDSAQQVLQQEQQQAIGLQQNIIQVQTLQQVTGHVQQTTTAIGQSKQHTIIVQGGAMTAQQQMPPAGVQHFVPVSAQKELPAQPLHVNGIAPTQMPTQYPSQAVVQPGVVMQQQQIPMQTGVMQAHVQPEHQLQGQMQAQRPTVQQFVPQQVQPSTQQYVMLSGQPILQPVPPLTIDERNRRIASLSAASNVSMDSGLAESTAILPEEKRQNVPVVGIPITHMQHVQIVPPDMSGAVPLPQSVMDSGQQLQAVHQNMQHVPGTVAQPVPVPLSVHPVATADIAAPKVSIKAKEVSSTLPDLAQNLANILSNPKSKSATPHPLTTHESTAVPNVAASTLVVDYKPVQSEQYFQPIQPEVSQLQIQPAIQHSYQGQVVPQAYQSQQNFQQTFQNQQLLQQLSQGQPQQPIPLQQSIPLAIPQQIDAQSQMVPVTLQGVSGQSIVQGKWVVSANQAPVQQPLRQPNQPPQLLQNQAAQLQQVSMPLQMQQPTMPDQQYGESSVMLDQAHLHLKLPEQHSTKPVEAESLESLNSDR